MDLIICHHSWQLSRLGRQLAILYVYASIAGFSGQLIPEQGIETKIGNPPATPPLIAALHVQKVVKIITGVGTPISNQILLVDAREWAIDRIERRR